MATIDDRVLSRMDAYWWASNWTCVSGYEAARWQSSSRNGQSTKHVKRTIGLSGTNHELGTCTVRSRIIAWERDLGR
jgi:hypothetical protein